MKYLVFWIAFLNKTMRHLIKLIIPYFLVFSFILFYIMFFGTAQVSGSSMNPTIENDDLLIVRKSKDVEINDIVMIYSEERGHLLCKRVIGVAGDHIVIKDGKLYRNDELIHEDYIKEQNWVCEDIDLVVEDNKVFVLGDNRNNSYDSRNLGCLSVNDIYGKLAINVSSIVGLSYTHIVLILLVCFIISIIFCIVRKYTQENKEV